MGASQREQAALLASQAPRNGGRTHRRLGARDQASSIRHDIWMVLRYRSSLTHRSGLQLASYLLELCILTLVLLNVILAISESTTLVAAGMPTSQRSEWYQTFLFVSTIIFSVEYVLRFWSCVEDERYNSAVFGRIKWMTRPMSVIDLLALMPFYLEIFFEFMVIPSYPAALTLRSLRLLRILSFLRLERSYSAMANLRRIFTTKKEELLVVSYLTAVIVLTSSTIVFFLENAAQPDVFSSVAVSAWWSVETITSLGYGDMVPQTTAGRLFGAVLALWGIILFTIPGAILGSAFIEVMLENQRKEEAEQMSVLLGRELPEVLGGEEGDHNHSRRSLSRHYSDLEGMRNPVDSPASQSLPRPSPRVATLIKMEGIVQKLDELAQGQLQLQRQMQDQRTEIADMKRMVEMLLARTDPTHFKPATVGL